MRLIPPKFISNKEESLLPPFYVNCSINVSDSDKESEIIDRMHWYFHGQSIHYPVFQSWKQSHK